MYLSFPFDFKGAFLDGIPFSGECLNNFVIACSISDVEQYFIIYNGEL